jgi:ABC-type cobalamin/Fe3+-siderophores transport system ATPase subunit
MSQDKVHMEMGMEETVVIGTALGFLIKHANDDITEIVESEGCGKSTLMELLSMKLTAATIYRELWMMLGVPAEEIAEQLASMEEE